MPWEISRGSGKWEKISEEYAESAISSIKGIPPKNTMKHLKKTGEGIIGGTITHSWMIRYKR